MISKCREFLEAHILIFFPVQHATGPPERITPATIMGTAMPCLKPPFLVDRAGISETGIQNLILPSCKLFNYKLIRNFFSCPRGGALSAHLSCPAWWGICHFLQAFKTNPHLYPRVGGEGVGVYFDWCIRCMKQGFWSHVGFSQRDRSCQSICTFQEKPSYFRWSLDSSLLVRVPS